MDLDKGLKEALNLRNIIKKATVRLPKKGGQGVLASRELYLPPPEGEPRVILTAAHCLDIGTTGYMTLDAGHNLVDVEIDEFEYGSNEIVEDLLTEDGLSYSAREFRADILFADPISDIAVLGCPDDQAFSKDALAYEAFCEMVKPVQLGELPPCELGEWRSEFPAFVWSHKKGDWIEGKGTWAPPRDHMMWTVDLKIERGTSGGPIVNEEGELVGIVSQGPDGDEDDLERPHPIPFRTLPPWVLDEFFNYDLPCRRVPEYSGPQEDEPPPD